MKKDFPTVKIEGTIFEVDVQQNLIRQQDNPQNRISFDLMEYNGDHYTLSFDKARKIYGEFANRQSDIQVVTIPQKMELDPEGMAKKYQLSIDAIRGKSDFEVMVDQELYNDRVRMGRLPVMKILEHDYFVDLRCRELRSTSDFMNKIDLRSTLETDDGGFQFFLDSRTKQVVNIENYAGSLSGIVFVKLPAETKMDPYAVARDNRLDEKDFLIKYPLQKGIKAETKPAAKTFAKEIVKINKQGALLKKKKGLPAKKKGPHL